MMKHQQFRILAPCVSTIFAVWVAYFGASDGLVGKELWQSDGATAGTVLIKDINPDSGDSEPEEFVMMDDILFFIARTDTEAQELWRSEGSTIGTALVKGIFPGSQE